MSEQSNTWHSIGAVTIDLSGLADADGLDAGARDWAARLADEYVAHASHNEKLRKYYEGDVKVKDYGVTASVECDQSCHWPAKAVDALAERVRLENFKFPDGQDDATLTRVLADNNFVANYNRYSSAKYVNGCIAVTVNRGHGGRVLIRLHSAETFTAIPSPDFEDGVVAAGLAVARREYTEWSAGVLVPTIINLHLPGNTWELSQVDAGRWVAEPGATREQEPNLYVLAHKPAGSIAPFGRTRITRFVRDLTDDAIRCLWHMQISGAYYSMPKLLMLNLTAEQYEAVMGNKQKFHADRVLAMEMGVDPSERPDVSQLSGNSPQPFIDELRALACQFSGATGVPLNSLGIVQDNPSSAEAIQAAREDICLIARQDIEGDKTALKHIALAAMAIADNSTIDALDERRQGVYADFEDPMLHSAGEQSNFVVQVDAVRPGFGQTDYAARLLGIPDDELDAVKSDETRAASSAAYNAMFGGASVGNGAS